MEAVKKEKELKEEKMNSSDVEDTDISSSEKNATAKEKRKRRTGFRIRKPDNWHEKTRQQIREDIIEQMLEQGVDDIDNDLVEAIVDDIKGRVRRKEFRETFLLKMRTATLAAMLSVLIMAVIILLQVSDRFVEKSSIQLDIKHALLNKSTLDELKMIYNLRAVASDSLWPILRKEQYYNIDNLSLQTVLEDLKADLLTSDQKLDQSQKEFKTILDLILQEHLKTNPFEGLDDKDKKEIKNIGLKLDLESYESIKPEIFSITESLKVKNSLIREYLSSSNMSLYISLAAFIFSILVTLWQFLPNAKASQRQIISEAIKEHMEASTNKAIKTDA